MVQLLKIKDKLIQFVGKYEIYVIAAVRFVIAYAAFALIMKNAGYMEALRDFPIPLLLALLCSFLPAGVMMFFAAGLLLLNFYALSMELCGITGAILLLMFFCYFRFTARKGLYAVLTPVLSAFGVPYVMPVATGLITEPYSVISVVCGEAIYFIVKNVRANAALFSNTDMVSAKSELTLTATTILGDKEMYLYLATFAVAGIVVYCVRRLKTNHAHQLAISIGIAVQMVMIGIGEIYFGNVEKMLPVIIGCVVSLVISLIISFLMRSLDYSRVETLQFEDDEYYYYVKAVPKSYVPAEDKQIKRISRKKAKKETAPKEETPVVPKEEQKEETV